MKDIVELNRFSKKCMDLISVLSKLHASAEEMVLNPTQEQVNKIAEIASQYHETNEEVKNCLVDFIKEVTSTEQEELNIDGKETDVGYKI